MSSYPSLARCRRPKLLSAALLLATGSACQAALLTFGSIQLSPNNPSEGLLSFIVSNVSGPSACDATFNVCTSLIFDNGLLQVNYVDAVNGVQTFTANLPNGFGPGDTDPAVFSAFTVDASTWTIGTVTFSGTLSPASVFLFGGSSAVLSKSTFSASFNAATNSFALLVANAGSPANVPEPSTWLLTTAGATALLACRRLRR